METECWNNTDIRPSGLNRPDKFGCQPIHLAAMAGSLETINLLLECGAYLCARTTPGERYLFAPKRMSVLALVLHTGEFHGRRGEALDTERLRIAEALVGLGAGDTAGQAVNEFALRDVLRVKEFPGLWDTLRRGLLKWREEERVRRKNGGGL
ncbi:hypothetical protein BDV19DRAFT_385257 [Aspergillus venezuelensis]